MKSKIPLPITLTQIIPSYRVHHVVIADKRGLFKNYFDKFNDTSDVTDEELAAFKARPSLLNNIDLNGLAVEAAKRLSELQGKSYDFNLVTL